MSNGKFVLPEAFAKALGKKVPLPKKPRKQPKTKYNHNQQMRTQLGRDKAEGKRLEKLGHTSRGFRPNDK